MVVGSASGDAHPKPLKVEQAVMAFAGAVVLLSVTLTLMFGPYWLLLTALVGLNLIQAAFTGFCPAASLLKRMGLKSGPVFGA